MNIFAQYTVGVDVKEDSAALVALRSSAKGFTVAGHELIVLDPKSSFSDRIAALGPLIKQFIENNSLNEPDVLFGISADKAIVRKISFPLAVRENLKETMRYEVEKYVPFTLNDICFDCRIIETDKKKNVIEVLLVVVKKKDIEPFFSLQAQVDSMSCLEIDATALACGISTFMEKPWKTLPGFLIRKTKVGINCMLIKRGLLYASHMVYPSEEKEGTDSLQSQINSCMADPVDKIVYCLGEEECESFSEEYGDSIIFQPLTLPAGLPSGNLLGAYCIALNGLRDGEDRINLLPENIRRKPRKTATHVTVFLVTLIAFLIIGISGNYIFKKKMRLRQLTSEITRLNTEAEGISQIQDSVDLARKKISFLIAESQKKTVMLDTLKELSLLLPKNSWIAKFEYSKNYVRISGVAETASLLVGQLESSYLFRDVSFLTPVRKNKEGKEKFTLGFFVNVNDKRVDN